MPEKDDDAGKLDKPEIVFSMVLIADDQSAKVVQPGEESFHFPAALEAAQGTTVLSDSIRPATLAVRSNHFGTELLQHLMIQRVTVIGLVSNEPLGHIRDESLLQGLGDQFHFSRASTLCAYGDRKTMAVCNGHDFGAL